MESCQKDIEAYAKEKLDYKQMPYLEQKAIREKIFQAVKANQNNPQEVEVLTYQGFKVVVPAYMMPRLSSNKDTEEKDAKNIPYVHLIKNNTYYLEIASEAGITARLNNFLEGLPETKKKYEEKLKGLKNQYETVKKELEKKTKGYRPEIEKLEEELEKINQELGME